MNYTGSQSEKAVAAGELNRSHIGQTVSFQSNEFTVVFGRLAGIARTEALVYLSLDGVADGTHLKTEFDLPVTQEVYLPMDAISNAEKSLSDAARNIREKLDDIVKSKQDRA